LREILTRRFAGIAAMLLAGCASAQTATSGAVPVQSSFVRTATGPPVCKGQRTAKNYASLPEKLKTNGGSVCVPAFGGFGGSIEYPGLERSVKLTIRTSTQNIYNEPQLGNGTSIVYLNLHFHASTRFRSRVKPKGGLTSPSISPGATYTAYGIVAVGHLDLMFPPCYTVATQGPYGGVLPNLGNLLRKATIAGIAYGVIEIYSGEQVSQEC
jgi:hypothetical protein